MSKCNWRHLLLNESLIDDFDADRLLMHVVNMWTLLDYSRLLPGNFAESVTEQLRMFQLERSDTDDFSVSDDVGWIVFATDADLNDRYVDFLSDEDVERHDLKELEIRWKVKLVVLLDLKSIEDFKEVVCKELLADGAPAQFYSFRYGNQMRRREQSGFDVVLA